MATPTSIATSYASQSDSLKLFDASVLGDLLKDLGARVSPAGVANDATLAALLSAASGEVEAACLCGHRYDVTDLQALTGASLAFLKQVVVYAAVGRALWRRRPTDPRPGCLEWAEKHLELLRQGKEIFGLVEAQDAGVETTVIRSVSDANAAGRITTRASRFYGRDSGSRW